MNIFQSFSSTPILGVIFLYILLLCVYKEAYVYHFISSKKKFFGGIFLVLILCLYAVQDTDYFHYMQELNRIKLGYISNLEDVYIALAGYVNYEYISFRLIVWGIALLLFVLSIYRINQPISLVLFYFVSMYMLRFSYARVSLAMAMGIFGYTFLIKPINKSYISYIVGILIIFCSTFFHKSAIIWYFIFSLSLIQLNKKRIFILLIIYPFVIYFFQNYFVDYLLAQDNDTTIMNSALSYMSGNKSNHGISAIIRNFLNWTPYYLLFILVTISVIKDEYSMFDKSEKQIINVSFFTIYIATIFLLNSTANTYIMFYRFLYYSILPSSILLSIYKKYDMYPRLLNLCLTFGIILCFYELFYSFYVSSLIIY